MYKVYSHCVFTHDVKEIKFIACVEKDEKEKK